MTVAAKWPFSVNMSIACLVLCFAGAAADAQAPTPQEDFLSSLKQAFKQDFDHEVVRGHFAVGSPPDERRYYCLVDVKTGRRQPNGVTGATVVRADGMTGLKADAVSLYSCASAEQQGTLVTTGYVLIGGAARNPVPVAAAPTPAAAPAAPTAASTAAATPTAGATAAAVSASVPTSSTERQPVASVDVAGIRLGMSADEVRTVLRSKHFVEYVEYTAALGAESARRRFVNVIAAHGGTPDEYYEVMLTPVPGAERVMSVAHRVSYPASDGLRESVLEAALQKKYGGSSSHPEDRSSAPTWRIQRDGSVQSGDVCERRGLVALQEEQNFGTPARSNLALKTTLDEFQHQIDHCGIAIVTEDRTTLGAVAVTAVAAAKPPSSPVDRIVKSSRVTAYSPSIGFEGASAAARLLSESGTGSSVESVPMRTIPNL